MDEIFEKYSNHTIALKKKHSAADDENSRYNGTVLGQPTEHRVVRVEGDDITSVREWAEKRRNGSDSNIPDSALSSRRQSSALSSLGDESMESMEF